MKGCLALVIGALTVFASAGAGSTTPRPLVGVPLRGATHLTLLVASNPPYLLDVDTGRRTRIRGLKLARRSILGVAAVGSDAVIHVERYDPRARISRATIHVLRKGATRAIRLGTASWEFAAAEDGWAVWLKSYEDRTHCTLREVELDGRVRRAARPIRCSVRLIDAGSRPFLVDGTSVLDPSTEDVLLDAGQPWAAAGDVVITHGGVQRPLTVSNLHSGEAWTLPYPSLLAEQEGTDEAAVHPNRRLVVLSFSVPWYGPAAPQVTDLWLLDLSTRNLQQLPDMPAAVSLKFTSMQWTGDGRLVLLAETQERTVVGVWRPGRKRIRVRPVRIPQRNSGSDSFVAWVVR
jgi:hypothetical protein